MTIHLPVLTTGTKSTLKPCPESGSIEITKAQYADLHAAVEADGYAATGLLPLDRKAGVRSVLFHE